jgi:L-amino acid N-acyltransferase YncA
MHSSNYIEAIASFSERPSDLLQSTGTTIIPVDSRKGRRLVSQYLIGHHCLLFIDPDVTPQTKALESDTTTLSTVQFRQWATQYNAKHHGSGKEFMLGNPPAPDTEPRLDPLDGTAQITKDLVTTLHEACQPDDVDAAEFDVDDLDPTLVGWVVDGALIALAGARPWDARPGLQDIGVLVHPEHRGRRAGTKVVGRVIEALMAKGEIPLYRCDDDNLGSAAIAKNTGFQQAGSVQAVTLPKSGTDDL